MRWIILEVTRKHCEFADCTRHPTPYTLHPTPDTRHPTPYTLHPTTTNGQNHMILTLVHRRGNPIEDAAAYDYIASYSPYDALSERQYPAVLATAGLTDPRVTYWEPAKWIAKLRKVRGKEEEAEQQQRGGGEGGERAREREREREREEGGRGRERTHDWGERVAMNLPSITTTTCSSASSHQGVAVPLSRLVKNPPPPPPPPPPPLAPPPCAPAPGATVDACYRANRFVKTRTGYRCCTPTWAPGTRYACRCVCVVRV